MARLVSATLESRYPVREFPADSADAIVVLGSTAYQARSPLPEDLPSPETYIRCRYAAWLYRHWRPVPVVATGGPAPSVAAADVMRHVLESEGVPPAMIWIEDRSRSTYENAAYTAPLLRSKGIRKIAVVTEAYHMARAAACFRKQGLTVVPAPCAYRSGPDHDLRTYLVPGWRAIKSNDEVLHEWIGLAWYTVSGRI